MTDQTPNGGKKPASQPAKKKTSAYDQPFNVMKEAEQLEAAARSAPPAPHVENSSQANWRSTPTPEPQKTAPIKEPQHTKPSHETSQKKKKSSSMTTKKAKNELSKQKASAPVKKEKGGVNSNKENADTPRSSRPFHKVLPYVYFGLALFVGVSLLLNIFCNWQNSLQDPAEHWMGLIGYHICYWLFGMFGPAVFTLPALLLLLGIYWKQYIDNKIAIAKIIASLTFIVSLAAVIHIFCLMPLGQHNFTTEALMRHGTEMTGGGVIGGSFGYLLNYLGNFTGSLIIGFFLLAASLFYLLGMTPQHLWNRIRDHRRTHSKRAPSYSKENAEDAEVLAKMNEKIRRTTSRQLTTDSSADFAAEAPLGAVRVVQPANKRTAEDKMAPMPLPKLDPTEEDKFFVPGQVIERMSAMNQEPAPSVYPSSAATVPVSHTQSIPTPVENKSTPAPDPALNRDAAVEPIFPKTSENRQVRRVPKADRNFDLKNIFIDLDESDARVTKKHAPVPPEVPISATAKSATPTTRPVAPGVARPVGAPTAKPSNPATKPVTAPDMVKSATTAAKPTNPAAKVVKPATAPSISNIKQAAPRGIEQPKDFGLSSEEFERLEAQQQNTLPRSGAAVKKAAPATPASEKKPTTQAKPSTAKPAEKVAKPKRYVFPPVSYLQPGEPITEENRAELEQSSMALAQTLRSFHVNIEDAPRYSCGPTVTRYEVTPAAGVRVRTITNLADDIALALRSSGGVRIEAPIPGTNSVGIEIPNRTRSTIYLRELIESKAFTSSQSKLTACLGSGIAGEPLMFDIAKMPHLLIAGTTGSGKSVCINCIVMSLLYKATPEDVRLIMIDPKKVEFSIYKNIPHLMAPVVTTPKDAAGALQAAVEEMEHRFELFEQVGVRDLKGYNNATKDDPDMPHLPYIVIIIDELADLMMTARDEVETAICRIAQKARAAGMHLIIGTQRPSADVVTGLIKANVPSRIAFAVKSQVDSRVILDHIGAESLTGRGDMLFVPIGSMRDTRVQGAFVDDKEVERICEFIRATNGTAIYDDKFIAKLKELAAQCGNKGRSGGDFVPAAGEDGGDKGADSKYADAVRVAIEEKRISTSLLQRKLEIGYSRAAKLIDRMQAEGYVSAPDGSKPRTILITPEEYMEKFIDNPSGGGEEA
jgi:DNA segregation ATPase FtsK/SpoIIIE-like protein